jgi:serine/threonine protein kinase
VLGKVALGLFAIFIFCGFSSQEVYVSKRDASSYLLLERLGGGSFGEAWHAEKLGSGDHLVVKFYKRANEASENIEHIDLLLNRLNQKSHPNLLHILKTDQLEKRGKYYSVVISEVAEENLDSFLDERFLVGPEVLPAQMKSLVKHLSRLHDDLLRAIDFLSALGLAHNDINPRNILKKNGRYVLADFDGVTQFGFAPPIRSWEILYAPFEFTDDCLEPSSAMTDHFSAASVLFYSISGLTPLEYYLEQRASVYRQMLPIEATWSARNFLRTKPLEQRVFIDIIRTKLKKLRSEIVDSPAQLEFDRVSRYILAALEPNPARRKNDLAKLLPELKIFNQTTPLDRLKIWANDQIERLDTKGVMKKTASACVAILCLFK